MTDPVFLTELTDPLPEVGAEVALRGPEGHHAATVRRIGTGETVVLSDGEGRGVRGEVVATTKSTVTVRVGEQLWTPEPAVRYVVAQALAKGDRSDLALEMVTEVGAWAVLPWQSHRSIVRWTADRADKAHAKWRATVREATKQSRRLRVPEIGTVRRDLTADVAAADLAVVLHEGATRPLADVVLPVGGTVLVVVGPEGGISPAELDALTAAGAFTVTLGDGVLRTSTAGVVALAAMMLR